MQRDGYTIIENAIEPDLIAALTEALKCDLGVKPAGNGFEGRHTVGTYSLLAHDTPCNC